MKEIKSTDEERFLLAVRRKRFGGVIELFYYIYGFDELKKAVLEKKNS